MLRVVCLFLLVGGALGYGYYMPKKPTKKCYQCQYVPPKTTVKTIFKTETFTKQMPVTKVHCWYQFKFDGKASEAQDQPEADCSYHKPTCKAQTSYKTVSLTRQVPMQIKQMSGSGGFEACKGPLTKWSAKEAGVDAWECHSNCYIRKDHHGRITRGCYKDELHVDPHMLGCHQQGDAMYCFCEDNLCNGV